MNVGPHKIAGQELASFQFSDVEVVPRADAYGTGNGSWPALQAAVVQPGNNFCGTVPGRFPAFKTTGEFVTGPTTEKVSDFNESCSSRDAIAVNWSGDSSGDDLSHAAVAGTGSSALLQSFKLCDRITYTTQSLSSSFGC